MTRKRFVKLMMANGCSRNRANAIAEQTHTILIFSYQDRYCYEMDMKQWENELADAFSDLANSFSQVSNAMEVLNASLKIRQNGIRR